MLRDKNLIPLSRQHQHALALCVRMDRAQPIAEAELTAWQDEIEQIFAQEISIHFSAEESLLFPAARRFPELIALAEELVADHIALRESYTQAQAHRMTAKNLAAFAQKLSAHIRKEERELFEQLQRLMSPEELSALGRQLEVALQDSVQSCALTNEAIRPEAKK